MNNHTAYTELGGGVRVEGSCQTDAHVDLDLSDVSVLPLSTDVSMSGSLSVLDDHLHSFWLFAICLHFAIPHADPPVKATESFVVSQSSVGRPVFPENCMKMKKFWPGGGGGGAHIPFSPQICHCK